MTAEQLAQAVGATKAQILGYENGHRVPDPPRIRELASALGVSPLRLMRLDRFKEWDVADLRRACGLTAREVVDTLGVAPKSYRRFEKDGIVPARRPNFLDEVASCFGVGHRFLTQTFGRSHAVMERRQLTKQLVGKLAARYVPDPGRWEGPSLQDPDLIALAEAYGRPLPRTRAVLAHELGDLRQTRLRIVREQIVADFDTDPTRQKGAEQAVLRWEEVYARRLQRIPARLEQFHRTAQPSNAWARFVALYMADARAEIGKEGAWMPTIFFRPTQLPRSMVERKTVEDLPLIRLNTQGVTHVRTFQELYAALYPTVMRPRPPARGRTPPENSAQLPNRSERIVIPPSALEALRDATLGRGSSQPSMELSDRFRLSITLNSLSVTRQQGAEATADFETKVPSLSLTLGEIEGTTHPSVPQTTVDSTNPWTADSPSPH
ncbi:helix-turn-helix transcriptional regulator [Streptomyces sp. NPDC102384]|uniref:helix-turn-helix transcriptional regulator n=1 Tax=unclassified Streptomyces TaxID=2593676 RepID=UPI003808C96F